MAIDDGQDHAVIPSITDKTADAANLAAIDSLVKALNHPYVVAWGKWLGFTPTAVQQSVSEAEADNAPHKAIQKIDGRWLTLEDINNDQNRRTVEEIANKGAGWTR